MRSSPADPTYLSAVIYHTGGHVGGTLGIVVAVLVAILFVVLLVVVGKRGMRYWR